MGNPEAYRPEPPKESAPSSEQPPVESGIRAVPEMREGWSRREYEYRNAAGELTCTAEVSVEQVTVKNESGKEWKGEVIRGLVLRSPNANEDGTRPSIDLFALTNLGDPSRAQMVVTGARNPMFVPEFKWIVTREPKDPVSLSLLMHEAGHAEQYAADDAMATAANAELRMTGTADAGDALETSMALDKLVAHVPDLDIPGLPEAQRQLEELAAAHMNSRLRSGGPSEKERLRMAEQFRTLMKGEAVTMLIGVMTRLKERDATARALKWLRKVKEATGIDLFQDTVIPAEDTMTAYAEGSCELARSVGVATSPRFELGTALGTYDARPSTLRGVSKSKTRMPKPEKPDERKAA